MNLINPIIADRKSEVAFAPITIPNDELKLLFEAARWAPSAFNEQPWKFYFASRENIKSFDQILQILAPGNREWAKNASAIIISTAKKHLARDGSANFYAMHDTALAEANLVAQAQTMGFSTHIMGGFDHDEARRVLEIPSDYIPVAAIAVGFKGDASSLSPALQKRALNPRMRKPIGEVVTELK